ncbi:MAG: modification enzyme, MiaB family [Firmicutes bacterium]|nr:modification enzyme, MiaB family [Bacillota bacterium]
MPFVALTTLGCKVNQAETDAIAGLFKERGYEVVGFDQPADVYVVNTCSVTHMGERKSRQLIRRAGRLNPAAAIVVTGCYAQISSDEVAAIAGVDVVVGTKERQHIVELAEKALRSGDKINAVGDIMAAGEFEDIPLFSVPGRTRAFLKIQEGCSNYCSYCIIPYARGPLRSRPIASVLQETEKLVAAGFKEIVLTGINLGAYGRDAGSSDTLTEVVKQILKVAGVVRIRLSSLESVEVSDEIITIMQNDERLCQHLHLPLQAGDDAVLKAMNRHYSTAEYERLVADIQVRVPDIAISTDIIVGFPGETTAMFNNTLKFVERINFARIHVFPYSRRQGTPAAEFSDQVPEQEKKRRVLVLQELADAKTVAFQSRFIGRKMTFLPEGRDGIKVEGMTGNYIRVYTDDIGRVGDRLVKAELKAAYRDGLWGKIID